MERERDRREAAVATGCLPINGGVPLVQGLGGHYWCGGGRSPCFWLCSGSARGLRGDGGREFHSTYFDALLLRYHIISPGKYALQERFSLSPTGYLSRKLPAIAQSAKAHLPVKSGSHPLAHAFLPVDRGVATVEELRAKAPGLAFPKRGG